MSNLNKEYYVLRYPNGNLLAISTDSGGYPYETWYPESVAYWHSRDSADYYRSKFENLNLELCVVTPFATIRPV